MDCLHDLTNIEKLCRVCLRECSMNMSLESALQRNRKDSPSILSALEKVMSVELAFDENYPSEICPNCLSLLNISYDLREQFQNSQQILNEHFTKCLEDVEENDDDNSVSSQAFVTPRENGLLIPKLEVDVEESDENYENVEYIYEENIENLEAEYLHFKMEQDDDKQSREENIQIDYIKESNELSDEINKSIQIDATSYKRKKGLQIKQLDIDKYIIEKAAEVGSTINLTTDHDGQNLSSLDEELIQAAYNLKYECPGCPKVYSSLRNLRKHKEICVKFRNLVRSRSQAITGNGENKDVDLYEEAYLYVCDQCCKSYLSPDQLEQHKQSVHAKAKLNIYEEFRFADLSELDQELFKGALLLKYECNTCPKVYSSPDKLEKHKAVCTKHKRKPLSKSTFNTKITPTRPDAEESVKLMEEVGSENLPEEERESFQSALNISFPCAKHEEKPLSKSTVDTKITPIQQDGEEDKSVKLMEEVCLENLPEEEREMFQSALNINHQCPNCGKLYLSEDRFKRHQMNCKGTKRTNLKTYHCEICGHMSTSKGNDFYHKQTSHEQKRYACDKCDKAFAVKSALTQHTQMHAKDVTKVVCPICGKGFHYSNGLFYHMKMHKKEMNYLCDYCDKRFIKLNSLKRHLATHTGERLYPCSICDKKFKGRNELKIHELRHSDERPYRCDYCDKGFVSKSNLQLHIITHKGSIPCDLCHRKFLDEDVLELHMKIKHKVQYVNPFL